MKGIIFYTSNTLDKLEYEKFLPKLVKEQILKANLPIVSCSLKPMDFGKNVVLDLEPCVLTMYKQILTALQESETKYVFFCEHDVLYHTSHFDFTPSRDDTFYYNVNVWRCHLRLNICTTYLTLRSVSGICANRELAIDHYTRRIQYIYDNGFDKIPISRNPAWARRMGFEPGKPVRHGGFSEEKVEDWYSEYPNLDIRHRLTMTPAKMSIKEFRKYPTGWKECKLEDIQGWDIRRFK